jgi:hypothetical protein
VLCEAGTAADRLTDCWLSSSMGEVAAGQRERASRGVGNAAATALASVFKWVFTPAHLAEGLVQHICSSAV